MFTSANNKLSASKAPASLPSKPAMNRRGLASTLLKKNGLVDKDADLKMSDAGPSTGSAGIQERRADERRKRTRERMGIPEKDKAKASVEKSYAAAMRLGKGSALSGRISTAGSSIPVPRRGTGAMIAPRGQRPDANNIQLLRDFVNSRYDKQRRYLNLEDLRSDPFFKGGKFVSPDLPSAAKDTVTVMMKLAGQLDPPPETVSFANNKFKELRQLGNINRYLPDLANLSLQNNNIEDIKNVFYLGSHSQDRLSSLVEVIFLGNPFREIYSARGELDRYQIEICKTFPYLKMLDMQPVVKVADFGTPAPVASTSKDDGPSTFDVAVGGPVMQDGVQDTTTAFLIKYFTTFDENRDALADVYAPNATFSVSINAAVPARARISRFFRELPHQQALNWEAWTALSRNLTRIKPTGEGAANRLFTSPAEIVKAMKRVPQTKHDIANGGNTFLAESWIVSSVLNLDTLFVTVHGQFTELPAQGLRSFDRTFILAPAPPDSKARQNGWEVVIISEQLHIRNYSSHEAWTPGPIAVQTEKQEKGSTPVPTAPVVAPTQPVQPAPVASQPAPDSILSGLPEHQRNLVIEFQRVTGLNVIWSGRCLEGNQWNPEAALLNFNELRPQIPPEAYVQ